MHLLKKGFFCGKVKAEASNGLNPGWVLLNDVCESAALHRWKLWKCNFINENQSSFLGGLDELFFLHDFINIPIFLRVKFRAHISLRADQHVMTKIINASRWSAGPTLQSRTKSLLFWWANSFSAESLFYCEGSSRPEHGQVVLNTERVWVIVLCNFGTLQLS